MRLIIDCCFNAVTLAVSEPGADHPLVVSQQPMERGQAEHLIPAVSALMRDAGLRPDRLSELVATAGPGSFTGVRIGLAAVRALALALGIPGWGMTTLAVLAASTSAPCLVVIPAPGGQCYAQAWWGNEVSPLWLGPLSTAIAYGHDQSLPLVSAATGKIDMAEGDVQTSVTPMSLVAAANMIDRAGARRASIPLYLRPPVMRTAVNA